MNEKIKSIQYKKEQLDKLRPLPKELIKNLNDWFKIEQTYTSNALEGNTLTRSETALVVEKGLTIGGKSLKEHLEAKNLAFAIDYVQDISREKTISLSTILDLHRLVLKGIDDSNAGRLRNIQVAISGSKEKLPEPIKVPELMDKFEVSLQENVTHPLTKAANAHLQLVKIHPFVDGNGRTARLLMNLILIQDGYPPVIIDPKNRAIYINAIQSTEEKFLNFIYEQAEASLNIYLDAASKTIDR